MTERWVFCFKWSGTRSLSEDEKAGLLARARKLQAAKWSAGLLAVLMGAMGIAGIILSAHGNLWGWALIIIGLVALCWSLSLVSTSETLALLYRRSARVGQVDRYDRQPVPAGGRVRFNRPSPCDYLEDDSFSDWESEEKFLELLDQIAGGKAEYFETPASDGVLVLVDGKVVERVVNVTIQAADA